MSHEHLMERLRAAIRLPGNLQKSCKFFCRGLDIRVSEVVRAAVLSVDRGQYEAAAILGYNPLQTTIHVVLPQALRIAVPSFMNGFSSIVKETSLVSVLPIIELTKLGNQIYAKTYHPFEIYISLAVLYFIMTYFVTFFAKWVERRLSVWFS